MLIRNLYKSYLTFYRQKKIETNIIKSMRIYLTESCNANCPHCFNKNIREEGHMKKEMAMNLFNYLKRNGVCQLKIMGGEPTVHPDFNELYVYSQNCFNSVALFTNALNDDILRIKPRKNDSIVYNFMFVNNKFNFDKLLPNVDYDFSRVFEIVIDSKTDVELLTEKINYVAQKCQIQNISMYFFQLTINCVENIFEFKELINVNIRILLSFLLANHPKHLSFDHTVPFCFWDQETINLMRDNKLDYFKKTCRGLDFGLIDANFHLMHCNQHPIILSSMIAKGNFVSFSRIEELLKACNDKKKMHNYKKACSSCKYFPDQCTGGCMMHKDFVVKK